VQVAGPQNIIKSEFGVTGGDGDVEQAHVRERTGGETGNAHFIPKLTFA
jgi:hypothetical protein